MSALTDESRIPTYGRAARAVFRTALGVFGVICAINFAVAFVPGLFYDNTGSARPLIIRVLGPLAIASMPVALVSGIVWLWAVRFVRRIDSA
jgi:hypothetical protein